MVESILGPGLSMITGIVVHNSELARTWRRGISESFKCFILNNTILFCYLIGLIQSRHSEGSGKPDAA
jgi:hypothetical protein